MAEEEMAIEAAIAFVKSINVEAINGDTVEGTTSDQDDSDGTTTDSNASPHTASAPDRAGSKRRYKPGYSTELLHRKKKEARILRNEVRVLEEWLTHLKRAHSIAEDGTSPGCCDQGGNVSHNHWAAKAMEEFRERRHAEKLNSTLKAIQASHVSIGKSILAVLEKASAIHETDFVLALHTRSQRSLLQSNFTVVYQLEEMAAKLYLEWLAAAPNEELSSCAYGMPLQDENVNNNVVRITSRVPVGCLPKEASDIAWKELKASCTDGSASHYINAAKKDTTFSCFSLTLKSGSGMVAAEGVQLFQKFQAEGGVVHVWVSDLISPTGKTAARAHAWMTFSKLASDPEYQSEIQFNARVFYNDDDKAPVHNLNGGRVRKTVLEPWSLVIREFALHLQEAVVQKTEISETTS